MAASRRTVKKAKKAVKPPKPLRKKHERKIAAEKSAREAAAAEISSRARDEDGEALLDAIFGDGKGPPPMPRLPALDERPPPPPAESAVSDRVAYCVLLMSRGQWHGYETRARLVEVWGVTDDTVKKYANEAHRSLALDENELAEQKVQHAKTFRQIQGLALSMRSKQTGLPDFGSALKAGELAAKFQGIEVEPKTKRVELTGKDGGPIETRSPVIMLPPEREE